MTDQYASRVVMSGGKAYVGMVTPRGQQGVTILLDTGKKVDLAHEELLGTADAAMFRAKSLGRNRVCEAQVPARTIWLASATHSG